MHTIPEIRRQIRLAGGALVYLGRTREHPPSGRAYWRNLYRLSMPGQLDQVLDSLSLRILHRS